MHSCDHLMNFSNKMAAVDVAILHTDAFLSVFVLPVEGTSIRIAVIMLDRKGSSSVNIIDEGLALSLARATTALRLLSQKAYIDCVVICSAKQGNFLAGADIKFELRLTDYEKAYADSAKLHHVMCVLEALPVPTVCILNGATLGGGLELALACDYRIADIAKCTQIGLPEVKLGLLPGAGGCVRLPRLIQLKNAVQMIVTGQAVTAKAARKLGLVDALFHETTTSAVFSQDGLHGLTFGWMDELKDCICQRRIGDRMLKISIQVSVSGSLSVGESLIELTESVFQMDRDATENLMSQTDWDLCEKKFTMKYPPSFLRSNSLVQGIIFSLALRGVRSSVGRCIPSPYACLETVHKCLKADTLQRAVSITSEGFATLVTTPQSKCLMGLFLQTRAIKKDGETFGLKPGVSTENRQGFEKDAACVVLPLAGNDETTGCFAQACIYSGIRVILIQPALGSNDVAGSDGITQEANWRPKVEKQFQYAVMKGHWMAEKVSEAINNLASCMTEEEFASQYQSLPPAVYLVALDQCDCALRLLSQSKEFQKPGNVLMITNEVSGVVPTATTAFTSEGRGDCVYTSLFTPLTRTMRAVEVYGSQTTLPESIRAVCSLFGAVGKLPILTNLDQMSVEHRLLVTFWAAVAHLLCVTTRSPHDIDMAATRLAGFTKGPFETMKEIGIQNVDLLVATMTESHWLTADGADAISKALSRLNPSSRSHTGEKESKPASLSDEQVTLYVFLAAVEAALHVVAAPGLAVSHSTLDVLCVGGLMRFPPQEGGPLCYLCRNGAENIGQRATELTQVLGTPTLELLQSSTLSSVFDELNLSTLNRGMNNRKDGVGEVQDSEDEKEFQWSELYSAGPCQPIAAFDAPQLPRVPWSGLLVIVVAAVLYLVVALLP